MDSGIAHMAEAGAIPGLAICPTVPAWTRFKYYRYVKGYDIAKDLACRPCFVIGNECPERIKNAGKELTGRDREIYDRFDGAHITESFVRETASDMSTTVKELEQEFGMVRTRYEQNKRLEPYCLQTVDIDHVIETFLKGEKSK